MYSRLLNRMVGWIERGVLEWQRENLLKLFDLCLLIRRGKMVRLIKFTDKEVSGGGGVGGGVSAPSEEWGAPSPYSSSLNVGRHCLHATSPISSIVSSCTAQKTLVCCLGSTDICKLPQPGSARVARDRSSSSHGKHRNESKFLIVKRGGVVVIVSRPVVLSMASKSILKTSSPL